MGKKSKRRLEMGEEKWAEYQKERKKRKVEVYRKKNVRKVVEWRRRTKQKLIEYKGGKCEMCGFDKPYVSCYDFHHVNPNEKEFRIGGSTKSFEKQRVEVDKCQLLCKNCHAEVHDIEYTRIREERIAELESLNNESGNL